MQNPIEISYSFTSVDLLYSAYMPFINGGGLFIRTKSQYNIGDLINVKIKLLEEINPYDISGKVVWVTPEGAQGNKPAGIGIQLTSENSRHLCNKIETYLAGMLQSNKPTDTM